MRLSASVLPDSVAVPTYDRSQVRRGVVHLGIGAFHRAHQATIFEAALAAGDLRWGVVGVSLRSPAVRDQMRAQDGLYTVVVRDDDAAQVQVIGAVLDVLVAPEDPKAVVAAIGAPDTHLVTLTVTEKGYKLDRASGSLDRTDADVARDLASLDAPRTVPGLIAAGLAVRRAAGIAAITVLSCDNLPHNGALLRAGVLEIACAHDPALADWIATNVAFPATMVDRIVPATTDDDIIKLTERIGVEDRAMVKTEPFLQWVVEDRFSGPRPDLARFGVQLTDAVGPWEDAKLRLLNGAHSGIAYLGGLTGDDFVHEFVARPEGRAFVDALWNESAATLTPPAGLDVASYREQLMARFANPSLQHRTRQIAADGSQKLPQRLIAPIRERRARGLPVDALALAVAAWMRWQAGTTDAGDRFVVDDPIADRLASARGVDALLAAIGADDIDATARGAIAAHLHLLQTSGARAAVASLGTQR